MNPSHHLEFDNSFLGCFHRRVYRLPRVIYQGNDVKSMIVAKSVSNQHNHQQNHGINVGAGMETISRVMGFYSTE